MSRPNALVCLQGAIEIYVNTHSCYDGMPEPDPHERIAIWMNRWEWNDIRDRIAALEAQLTAANARIAELEGAEERAYRAGYDMGHKNGANGVCFLPDGFWLAYKAGGES